MFKIKNELVYGPTRKDLNNILKQDIKKKEEEIKILKKELKTSIKKYNKEKKYE